MQIVDKNGILEAVLYDQDGTVRGRTPAHGGALVDSIPVESVAKLYNGSTLDFEENNLAFTILASASRAASTTSAALVNRNATGALFVCNVTANPGGGETLRIDIQVVDPVAGALGYITGGASALGGGADALVMIIYPGITSGDLNGRSYKDGARIPLPRDYKVKITHSASGNWTYSVSGLYLR